MPRLPNGQFQTVSHVGWGDTTRHVIADFDLGIAPLPKHTYGIRKMIWDAAFGYVNGFRKRDILYFILTRSMSEKVWMRVYLRNAKQGKWAECNFLPLSMKDEVLDSGHHY